MIYEKNVIIDIRVKRDSIVARELDEILNYPINHGAKPWDYWLEQNKIEFNACKKTFIENFLSKSKDLSKNSLMPYVNPHIWLSIVHLTDCDLLKIDISATYLEGDNGKIVSAWLIEFCIFVWNLLSDKTISGQGSGTWEHTNPNDKDVWATFPWDKYIKRETYWLNFVKEGESFPKKYRHGSFTDSPEFDWYKIIPIKHGKLFISSPLPYSLTSG